MCGRGIPQSLPYKHQEETVYVNYYFHNSLEFFWKDFPLAGKIPLPQNKLHYYMTTHDNIDTKTGHIPLLACAYLCLYTRGNNQPLIKNNEISTKVKTHAPSRIHL